MTNISQEDGVSRCLDDSSLGLRVIPCNNLPFQHWDWNAYTQVYEFVNNATGGCLADGFFGPHTERCNGGGSFQTWRQVRTGELMNVGTGLCLDYSNQFQLRTFGCNAGFGGYQYWWL